MSINGFIRAVGVASRAAERDAKRRQRELEKQQKAYDKMLELEQAAYEVENYENLLDRLVSIHKESSVPISWGKIANSSEPGKPKKLDELEKEAKEELENYTPSFWHKLFRLVERKRDTLVAGVELARKTEDQAYQKKLKAFEQEHSDWQNSKTFAGRIIAGDLKAYCDSFANLNPLDEISELGSSLNFKAHNKNLIEAHIKVHGNSVIPKESKSLLQTGKLKTKELPKSKFNEIYQDYVCSCALRIANESFAVLPIETCIVSAIDDLLDTKTGHIVEQPILTVVIQRKTLERINLATIYPSDSMSNFIFRMDFKKNTGFKPVKLLSVDEIEA